MKTVCIDARMWGIKHTGIGRYVENLIDNLPPDPQTNVVLIVSPEVFGEPKLSRFNKYVARHHPYSISSQFEMFWLLLKIRPDLLHVTHFTIPVLWPGKIVITIHDLIKHLSVGVKTSTRNPVLYWFKYLGYLLLVRIAVSKSNHIIVPAEYWKQFLIKKYSLSPSKVSVTYEGVSDTYLKSVSSETKLPFTKPFVVYTGNLYPHKNIRILIEAINILHGKYQLGIICARSVFADRLPKSPHVKFLGKLTDEQAVYVYKKSTAFVTPSLIEGFGLPGLEAMAVGTPVIAANASVLPEIYGPACVYFDPHDSKDLANKINKISKSLVLLAYKQVAKYSWVTMSSTTWKIYQKILH